MSYKLFRKHILLGPPRRVGLLFALSLVNVAITGDISVFWLVAAYMLIELPVLWIEWRAVQLIANYEREHGPLSPEPQIEATP